MNNLHDECNCLVLRELSSSYQLLGRRLQIQSPVLASSFLSLPASAGWSFRVHKPLLCGDGRQSDHCPTKIHTNLRFSSNIGSRRTDFIRFLADNHVLVSFAGKPRHAGGVLDSVNEQLSLVSEGSQVALNLIDFLQLAFQHKQF